MRIDKIKCQFIFELRIVVICTEYNPKTDTWSFWTESCNTQIWTKTLVRKHAPAIGSLRSFCKINRGSIEVKFDRHPNFTQLARFIELCSAEQYGA